jgi:hypothetical protein
MGLKASGGAGRITSGHGHHDLYAGKYGVPLTTEDRNWIASALREEFRFLDKFVDDIVAKAGTMPYPRRAAMYADSLDNMFHSGRMHGLPESSTLFYWITSKRDTVCLSCKFLEGASPFTKDKLPTMPRSGITRCLSNCHCRVITKHAPSSQIRTVRKNLLSRAYYVNRLKRLKSA